MARAVIGTTTISAKKSRSRERKLTTGQTTVAQGPNPVAGRRYHQRATGL
jgi:hypothetical protein